MFLCVFIFRENAWKQWLNTPSEVKLKAKGIWLPVCRFLASEGENRRWELLTTTRTYQRCTVLCPKQIMELSASYVNVAFASFFLKDANLLEFHARNSVRCSKRPHALPFFLVNCII